MSDTTKQQQGSFQPGDTALCRGRGYGPAVVRVVEAKLVDSKVAYTVQSVNNPAATWLTGEAQLEPWQPSSRSPKSGRKARRSNLVLVLLAALFLALWLPGRPALAQGGVVSNHAPVATDDTALALQNRADIVETRTITLPVLANDADPDGDNLTITAVGTPLSGSLVEIEANRLWLTYTPAMDFTGADSFTYTVSDSGGLTDTAVVTVTVVNGLAMVKPAGVGAVIVVPNAGVSRTITVTVEIPADAVPPEDADLVVVYGDADAPGAAPPGYVSRLSFSLDVYRAGQRQALYLPQQLPAARVTIEYADQDVAGLVEWMLELRYWTGSEWVGNGIGTLEWDIDDNRMVATLLYLSEFGLFGQPESRQQFIYYLPFISKN